MPCDTVWRKKRVRVRKKDPRNASRVIDVVEEVDETQAEQKQRIADRVALLDRLLAEKRVTVKIGPQGAVAFVGWKDGDRDGITDVCAYRKLTAKGSFALRQAVAKAEVLAGRRVDEKQVVAGTHSHDGGHTWGKGH